MRARALAFALISLAACNERRSERSAPTGGSATTAGSAQPLGDSDPIARVRVLSPSMSAVKAPPLDLPKQESFELVDAGSGTRAPVRYRLADGTFEHAAELALSTRQLEGAAYGAPVAMPPIRDGFQVVVGNGAIVLRALDPTITGASTPTAEAYVASLKGRLGDRRASITVDDRGQLGAISFTDDPTGARGSAGKDELAQRLLATVVPFPAEAIGTGASWRVKTVMRQGPLYIAQTATYQLLERTATSIKVHVTLLRLGEPQLVVDPNLPPDTVADLVALFRKLEGDLVIDPTHALAASGSLAIESRLHVRLTTKTGQTTEQITEDTGTITLSSK